jgi:hypothetical protein
MSMPSRRSCSQIFPPVCVVVRRMNTGDCRVELVGSRLAVGSRCGRRGGAVLVVGGGRDRHPVLGEHGADRLDAPSEPAATHGPRPATASTRPTPRTL